jgi:hypothetical protein
MLTLMIPTAFINTKKDQVSDIDNRRLTEFPELTAYDLLMSGASLAQSLDTAVRAFDDYIMDRVGFRSQLILANQRVNDGVFGIMTHPIYEYGKEGHVYLRFEPEPVNYNDYIQPYARFVKQMQDYCDERGAAFYYALNPAKTIVYPEFLPGGVHYRHADYKALLGYLSSLEVNYIDIAEVLFKVKDSGTPVFNTKYDTGHWNAQGAFYGLSAILERMGLPALNPEDFNLTQVRETSLLSSQFSIDEMTPLFTPKAGGYPHIAAEMGGELRVGSSFPFYVHIKNPNNPDGPRIFVFHGSHIRDEYKEYIMGPFSEAVFVYSYFIIDDLPYYFNIFQPDIVLYEAADRSLGSLLDVGSFTEDAFQPGIAAFGNTMNMDVFNVTGIPEFADTLLNGNGGRRLMDAAFTVENPGLGYAYLRVGEEYLDCGITYTETGAAISAVLDTWRVRGQSAALILITEDGSVKQTVPIL